MKLSKERLYDLFMHRNDVFAIQQPTGAYFPEKRPITMKDLESHLNGDMTIGSYCLNLDNTVKWGCIDLDGKVAELRRLEKEANVIYSLFPEFGRILEFSGRKGYHVWVFFKRPTQALYAQRLIKARLNSVELLRHEVFPKQTELNANRKYGNLVKIPCGVHTVSYKRSKILKMEGI